MFEGNQMRSGVLFVPGQFRGTQAVNARATLKALATAAASALLSAGLALPARAQNFTVNSTNDRTDQNPGDGICSTGTVNPDGTMECTLRAAIQESNASSGAHVITLPAGTYDLTLPTACSYTISTFGPITQTTVALCFTGGITINGAGSTLTIVDAGRNDRAAQVSTTATVVLQGLTMQNAVELEDYGATAGGGCINNQGTLTLFQTTLTGCTGSDGGGVYSTGTLSVINSSITGNSGLVEGGGVYNLGTVSIANSVVSLNAAPDNGGGLCNCGDTSVAIVTESVISGNAASSGGGIENLGQLTVTNTTISGNQASSGGGIQTSGAQATMNNLTIAQNTASNVGGGFNGNNNFTIANSIIAGNTSSGTGTDCDSAGAFSGTGMSLGHNLIQNAAGCGLAGDTSTNITGVDPMLGPLAANVMALLPGSPAIDAGSPSTPGSGGSACAITDQRGIFRPQGGQCDIGAFEATPGVFLSAIFPAQGGSGGQTTAVVSGNGILSGATLQLQMSGQPSIVASPVTPGQTVISGTFDLSSAAQGSWNVVVTNPDGTAATLPGGFTVVPPQSPAIFTSLQGRSAIRAGLPAVFSILVSNRGNTDVFGVPISLSAPTGFLLGLLFPVPSPPSNSSQVITDWSESPLQVNTTQSVLNNVPIFLPVVPAGYTGLLTFVLTLPADLAYGSDFFMFVYGGTPFFNPGLDPGLVSQFISAAQSYASSVIGVTIPSTLSGSMETYITNQLQTAIANGRSDLVAGFGGQSDAYSMAEFVMDLAAYAAAQVESSTSVTSRENGHAKGNRPRPRNCKTVPLPGESCHMGPVDIPPPKPGGVPPGCSLTNLANCGSLTPGDCQALPGYQLSADGTQCVPKNKKPCPLSIDVEAFDCKPYKILTSNDPNDLSGPLGAGAAHFLPGAEPLSYTITFENQATASAPAQTVVVTDQLDTANLDLSTFAIGAITFGNSQVTPPSALQQYTAGLDFRPSQDLQVKIQAALNASTGLVTWTFSSIDPDTGQLTTNPSAGFLPPDVTPPQGLGTIIFTIMPKAGIATNATTCNQATVVFDVNPALTTDTWCNSFDVTPPVSQVTALPAVSTASFQVQWSGTDVGSGIEGYSVFVSDNGGTYTAFQTDTSSTSATFAGQLGHTYRFYSIATDYVGNVEAAKTAAEASTTVKTAATVTLGNLTATYDGTAKAATATTVPANLTVTFTYNGNSTAPTTAGSYTVVGTVSDPDYAGSSTGTLTISQAAPTIAWLAPAAIYYGSALGSGQLDATANVPGVLVYTPPAGTILPIGNGQTLSVAFTPSDTTDYSSASASTTINVIPTPCDLAQNGNIDVADVQRFLNEAQGVISAANDLNGDGVVNVVDVQIGINAALGLGCTTGSGSNSAASAK